jgi:hypothetical protein
VGRIVTEHLVGGIVDRELASPSCGHIARSELLRRFIALFNRVGFAHVFALLGLAIPLRAFLMINMGFRVDSDLAISARRLRRGLLCGRHRRGSIAGADRSGAYFVFR